jgi:hypothetical protein
LKDIIAHFENPISITNICGAIDGTHILLVDLPSKKVTLFVNDFSIGKNSIVLCCKLCVMQTKSFGTFVLANLKGYMMVGSSRGVTYMHN